MTLKKYIPYVQEGIGMHHYEKRNGRHIFLKTQTKLNFHKWKIYYVKWKIFWLELIADYRHWRKKDYQTENRNRN